MNKSEFKSIMTMIKGAYGSKFHETTTEMLDTWYNCLSDLDGDRLRAAAAQYIKDNHYVPAIADLRTAYKNMPDPEPDAFDRFKNLPADTIKELMQLGIITEDAGIDLYNATTEHVELLQRAGAL